MKKILILANNSTGLYNFRYELINKMIRENYHIYFTAPQKLYDDKVKLLIESGAEFIHTPMNRRGMNPFEDIKLINQYDTIIKDIEPDIILTYTIKPNIYGNYIANKHDIPLIMNITGIGSSLATGKLKALIKTMYKYASNKSTIVFFQNEGNQDFFISNNLVDKRKTRLIPGSGVNIERFQPLEESRIDETIKFLFIGRLMKDKGIEEYLELAKRITRDYKNIEFQILGSFEEVKYKEFIEENINNQIKYLGSSADVRNEIKEVDCIVHPSYHEGMSNVLLEAGAMGKPLIASNIPGCKEIIDDKKNGYLFEVRSVDDLYKKIVEFIELDQENKRKMGKHSRKKIVEEFDRQIVVDEYMEVIEEILGE